MLKPTPFIYLRHGETDWNVQERAMGQQDIPLNATGIAQALHAREELQHHPIDTICHSPLSRAKATAEILNEVLGCRMVCIEDLAEFHLGPFQGRIKEEWFKEWRSGKLLEGVEPYADFLTRALRGINTALSCSPHVLIVAHGGIYWAVEHYAHFDTSMEMPNCTPVLHSPPAAKGGLWQRHPSRRIP